MTEYITKEQAIAVVKEAIANIVNSDSETVNLTDLEIEIQMTITDYTDAADVVEVTRCKDCGWAEFYETSESEDIYECNFWNGEHYGEHARVGGNDYCSYGSMR